MARLSAAEVLTILNLNGMSALRAVSELNSREYSADKLELVFRDFAGNAPLPKPALLETVVAYMVYDAAAGKDLDVQSCLDRANALYAREPSLFTEKLTKESDATVDAPVTITRRPREVEAPAAPVAPKASEPATPEPPKVKRGRPPSGQPSVYDRVKDAYIAATDRSRDTMVTMLVEKMGLNQSTATVYWYKVKKEVGA